MNKLYGKTPYKKITIFVIEIRILFLYDGINQMMVNHYPILWLGRFSLLKPAFERFFISICSKNTFKKAIVWQTK